MIRTFMYKTGHLLSAILVGVMLCVSSAAAQISANENASLAEIEALLEGQSIDIDNIVVEKGTAQQSGTFSGGAATLGIPEGVYVSTGRGSNFGDAASVRSDVQNNGQDPDADLVGVRASASRDTSALSLEITPSKNTIFARFSFASEEYPEYVCSQFNDAFGLFISGPGITGTPNMAIVPGTGTDVSINTVNNGLNNDGNVCTGETSNNAQFYNDNASSTNFIFDGYTDVFEVVVTGITPGEVYDFKMVVADAVDNIYDSAVFLEVFDSRWLNNADLSLDLVSSIVTPIVNEPFQITATVTNDGPDLVEFFKVKDLLPDGLSLVNIGGGTYDAAADEWTSIAPLLSGDSVQLSLTVMSPDTSTYTTTAEIIEQWANDIDSTPDNLATEPAEDDTASLTVGPLPEFFLSGAVIEDSGLASGTAFDAILNGGEGPLGNLEISLTRISDGTIIATTLTDGNGAFILPLDQNEVGEALTLKSATGVNLIQVSESPSTLSSVVNPSPYDGEMSFTLAAGTSYSNIVFGQIKTPTLASNRSISVQPGGAVTLAHSYTATATGSVDFSVSDRVETIPGLFSTTLYHDINCSGDFDAGDVVLTSAVPTQAGETICVLLRHASVNSATVGSSLKYRLNAATSFTGITPDHSTFNDDQVTVSNGGTAELFKQVCNLTVSSCNVVTGAGFATNNTGKPGDVLQYRLQFRSTGAQTVSNLNIFDGTPDYSALKASSAQVILPPANMSCDVVLPDATGGPESYEGPLQWQCTGGEMSSGDVGVVAFEVEIDS